MRFHPNIGKAKRGQNQSILQILLHHQTLPFNYSYVLDGGREHSEIRKGPDAANLRNMTDTPSGIAASQAVR